MIIPLIVLLISTFLEAVFSFVLAKKDYLSPSFVLSCVFCFGSVLAIVGDSLYWKESISWKGPVLIIVSIFFVIIGEALVRFFLSKIKGGKSVGENPLKFWPTKYFLLFLCYGVFVDIVFFVAEYRLLVSNGWTLSSEISFLSKIRSLSLSGIHVSIIFYLLKYSVDGMGFAAMLFFFKYFFSEKHNRKKWLIAMLVVPMIFSQILSAERIGFLQMLCVAFSSFVFSSRKQNWSQNTKKIFWYISICACLFLVFYLISGKLTGKLSSQTDAVDSVCIYGGSSIVALDLFFREIPQITVQFKGSTTFYGIFNLLHRFFPAVDQGTIFSEFIWFTNGDTTNVFTAFRGFYLDFGYWGNFVLCFSIGGIACLLLYFANSAQKANYLTIFYGFVIYEIFAMLFNPNVTAELLTVAQTCYIFFSFVFYSIFKRLTYGKSF